jgi:hypothetical protein
MGGPGPGCPRLCAIVTNQGDINACLSLPYYGTHVEYAGRFVLLAYASAFCEHVHRSGHHKENWLSVSDYYAKMSHYADELTTSGAPLRDDELVAYLLVGLDEDFNPVFTAMVARVDPINPSELYAQLLSFQQHTNLEARTSSGSSSAMMVSHDRGSSGGHGSRRPTRGTGCGRSRGRGPSRGSFSDPSGKSFGTNNASSTHPQFQLCLKIGHTAKTCWYRYEEDPSFEQRNTALAASSSIDNNWYTDSGAMDHITGDLNKLTMHNTYLSNDQIHAANGSGMDISCIGNSITHTPSRNLMLNNVLHVPSTHKSLISVHRFTLDNDTFIEFHPYFFLIKDQKMRKVLLHGPCKGGLYPLPFNI